MERLTKIGFQKVGEWVYPNNVFNHTIISDLEKKNLLYAFTSENEVLYIGKTTNTLKNRMDGYKNAAGSQRTNIRIKNEVLKLLKMNKSVEIHILLDNADLKFKNYNVSLASGLEDNLIATIIPKWNFRGNSRIKEQVMPSKEENVIVESLQPLIVNKVKTIQITLGKEYWNKGFFNFSMKDKEYLPKI